MMNLIGYQTDNNRYKQMKKLKRKQIARSSLKCPHENPLFLTLSDSLFEFL